MALCHKFLASGICIIHTDSMQNHMEEKKKSCTYVSKRYSYNSHKATDNQLTPK